MEMMFRYFKYHFKNTIVRAAVMLFLSIVFIAPNIVSEKYRYGSRADIWYFSVPLYAFVFLAFAVIIPFFEQSALNNRRNLDLWYSFPLSRPKIHLVNYLNGIAQILAVHLVNAVVSIALASGHSEIDIGQLCLFMMIFALIITVVYSLSFFMFGRANNTFDGIVFTLAYFFGAPALSLVSIYSFFMVRIFESNISNDIMEYLMSSNIFIDMVAILELLSSKINPKYESSLFDSEYTIPVIAFIIISIVIIGLLIFSFFDVKRRDVAKVQGVSTTWFGYKVIIPVVALAIALSSSFLQIIGTPFYAGSLFLAYLLFRRGVKFKLGDIIVMGTCVLIYIVVALTSPSLFH